MLNKHYVYLPQINRLNSNDGNKVQNENLVSMLRTKKIEFFSYNRPLVTLHFKYIQFGI